MDDVRQVERIDAQILAFVALPGDRCLRFVQADAGDVGTEEIGQVRLRDDALHLGVGHDETTEDGTITLEHLECNAACDYAPVVMVNWEFFDNQTPQSAKALVDDLRAGKPVKPSRGADTVVTWKEAERVLAGFYDGRAGEGTAGGPATLEGLRLAKAGSKQ